MDVHLCVSSIIILCFFLTILPPSYCGEDDPFVVCNRPYNCGSFNIPYPFWGDSRPEYCDRHPGYKLSCINNEYPVLGFKALNFRVLNINPSNRSFTIARSDLWDGPCPQNLLNTSLDFTLFDYAQNVQNVTIFYGCPTQDNYNIPLPNRFNCGPESVTDGKFNAYIVDKSPLSVHVLPQLMGECDNNINVPILNSSAIALAQDPQCGAAAVGKAMNQGFEVEYSFALATLCRPCEASGGVCGSNSTQPSQLVCFCGDQLQVQPFTCPTNPSAGMHACSLSSLLIFLDI